MVFECKCHGISASCATRTCWKALPSIRHIGKSLKGLYKRAVPVKEMTYSSSSGKKSGNLVLKYGVNATRPDPYALVYLDELDLYCDRNLSSGIPGTRDRVCNKTLDDGQGSCTYLCCGRGYDTHNFTEVSQCKCKFHWCCEVKCKQCVKNVIKHTCK